MNWDQKYINEYIVTNIPKVTSAVICNDNIMGDWVSMSYVFVCTYGILINKLTYDIKNIIAMHNTNPTKLE